MYFAKDKWNNKNVFWQRLKNLFSKIKIFSGRYLDQFYYISLLGKSAICHAFTQEVKIFLKNFENPYINRKSSFAKIKELGDNVIKMLIMVDIFQTFQFW